MQIFYQNNINECGISVLQSLINHFHHKKISSVELLTKANLTEKGLSVYDLETIGLDYGILMDSYELSFEEFLDYKNNNFFVLIINNDNNLHYVIAKKQKKYIDIFCSDKGYYQLKYEQLRKIWTGILIECKKTNIKIKKFEKYNLFNNLDWQYLLTNNIINLIIIGLSVFSATFIQQILNHVINNQNLSNLFSIVLIFLTVFITKVIGNYFIGLWNSHHTFLIYRSLHKHTLLKLENKQNSFFNKIDANLLRNIDEHLINISSFYGSTFNKFISESFLSLISMIIIFIMNQYIGLICICLLIVNLIFELIDLYFQKNNYKNFQSKNNEYHNNYNKFIHNLANDNYLANKQVLLTKLKQSHDNIKKIYYKSEFWNYSITNISHIFFQIIYMMVIFMACFFIVEKQTLSFAQLSFQMALIQMIIQSSKSVFNILKQYESFKYSLDIFNRINKLDNYKNNIGVNYLNQINKITFNDYTFYNNTLITGKSGCGKTTLLKKLCNLIDCKDNISFNEIIKDQINDNVFKQQFIYVNNHSEIEYELISDLINDSKYQSLVISFLNKLDIKDIYKLSSGQKQIVLFLSLIKMKNKVILADEILANIDHEIKKDLLTFIKPIIVENNFLLYVSHDTNICGFFNEVIKYE